MVSPHPIFATILLTEQELKLLLTLTRTIQGSEELHNRLYKALRQSFPEPKSPISSAEVVRIRAEANRLNGEIVAKLQRQRQCTASDMEEFMRLDREIEELKKQVKCLGADKT